MNFGQVSYSPPDVIIGLLTTQTTAATTPTDYALQDWSAIGLNQQFAFRAYLVTMDRGDIRYLLGHLTERDWKAVQERIALAITVPPKDILSG